MGLHEIYKGDGLLYYGVENSYRFIVLYIPYAHFYLYNISHLLAPDK